MKIDKDKLKQCGIDYEQGILFFAEEEKLYMEYLEKLLAYDFYTDFHNHMQEGEVQEAVHTAERYKSLTDYICIPEIQRVVGSLIRDLQNGKRDLINGKMEHIEYELERIRSILGVRETSPTVEGIDF